MRIAVINQRLSLIQGAVDVHAASGGRFGPGPVYDRCHRFVPGRS